MKFSSVNLLLGIFLLFSCVNLNYGLECITCNVTKTAQNGDDCNGVYSKVKCQGNSVCLSAEYEVWNPGQAGDPKTFVEKTCYQNMAGKECEQFVKVHSNLFGIGTKVTSKKCYVCREDDCNRLSSGSETYLPALWLACLVNILLAKLLA
ncbi:uncharacterized protein LOC132701152 [Cylas formicarius]|uniref:uncharacterized protein LOC132701152 n=1 Tax=Cylas formicarius TaxID=197179 RepID=UPI002958CB8D|nr:uncharacterized protein LOC132701152 [Cylas formicarius]